MSQRTWLLVKGTPAWVYKQALILNCNHLIISYILLFIYCSYMDYFVIFQVFWIILVWANFVRLIWYQSKFWSGPWPHFIQTLFELACSQPLHSELLRSQGFWPKIGFWPFKYSKFLWLSWSLTIIRLLATHKIFRVSLNLVLDHTGFWPFENLLKKNVMLPDNKYICI